MADRYSDTVKQMLLNILYMRRCLGLSDYNIAESSGDTITSALANA